MNPNKAPWEKGDFTEIAQFMRESGEKFARSQNTAGDEATAIPATFMRVTVSM